MLIEINSHSLFSKWFSESGKLVQKLFDRVHDYAQDTESFVTVMIDEVESLTAARAGAMNGSEPGDALRVSQQARRSRAEPPRPSRPRWRRRRRWLDAGMPPYPAPTANDQVVNALLTQLDKLKQFPNVLVMATSNLAGSIDSAFIDRADIKQYVGLPSPEAIYWILSSCLRELGNCGLASGTSRLLRYDELPHHRPHPAAVEGEGMTAFPNLSEIIHAAECTAPAPQTIDEDMPRAERRRLRALQASASLLALAERCAKQRISGRFLRRVPLVAHSRYLKNASGVRVERWIAAFAKCIDDEVKSMSSIEQAEGRKK